MHDYASIMLRLALCKCNSHNKNIHRDCRLLVLERFVKRLQPINQLSFTNLSFSEQTLTMQMQENLAYSISTVQASTTRAEGENVYDIPEIKASRLENQKKEDLTTATQKNTQSRKKRLYLQYIEIPLIIATILTLFIFFFIQLSNNTSQQQEILMCKVRVQDIQGNLNNTLRLMTELSTMQENISKQFREILSASLISNTYSQLQCYLLSQQLPSHQTLI